MKTKFILLFLVLIILSLPVLTLAASDSDLLRQISQYQNRDVENTISGALDKAISLFLKVVIPLISIAIIAWTGIQWAKGKPDGFETFLKAVSGVAIAAGSLYIVAWIFDLF